MKSQQASSKVLHMMLWVAQLLLAVLFIMAGVMKTFQPIEELAKQLPWAAQMPGIVVRFIGISEMLGALGLVLPALLRIKPYLTSLAALGLTIIMLLAAVFHLSKGEASVIGINLLLGSVAAFIVWGRYKKVPVKEKGLYALR